MKFWFQVALALGSLALLPIGRAAMDEAPAQDADVIVTAAPAYNATAALRGGERFPKGANLMLVHAGKAAPLLENFAASADASISFDGVTVLFAGKEKNTDPWQVFELTLATHAVRKVLGGEHDLVRPLYLPGQRMVYAERGAKGFVLMAANLDGSKPLALTYGAASALPADVLADGRVLFEAEYPLGAGTTPEMYLVYTDGSGLESYRCDHGAARWGGRQLASGDVVFTHGATLARFTSALANEEPVTAPRAEFAGGIAETAGGTWLLGARTNRTEPFALQSWKPGSATMKPILAERGINLLEPVLVAAKMRPHQHPSALHPWNYANLLALDAHLTRDGILRGTPSKVRLETRGTDGRAVMLGTAPIEKDGSFFIKVPGDKPIRISVLDARGTVLRSERGWFWSRAGEQRICVGCHTGPEHASENRVPAVLDRTTTPADLTGAAPHTNAQGGH
jgi:hypothetical protein